MIWRIFARTNKKNNINTTQHASLIIHVLYQTIFSRSVSHTGELFVKHIIFFCASFRYVYVECYEYTRKRRRLAINIFLFSLVPFFFEFYYFASFFDEWAKVIYTQTFIFYLWFENTLFFSYINFLNTTCFLK